MFTPEEIKNFVENNPRLVVRKESTKHKGLFVLKYHNRVFYDNLWTPELMEMRGLVVDKDYNVVVLPFTKIFNRFENGTDIDRDEEVVAVRKVNGFMAALTYNEKYGPIVSTTGSLDSDFVTLAEKYLMKDTSLSPNTTFLFEICDTSDPHIIMEKPGAYLIGARDIGNGEMYSQVILDLCSLGFLRPEWKITRFSDVVQETKNCKHEGFVVYGKDKALKIKSPYYLTKKLFARINPNKITEEWLRGCKRNLDEEYYPLIDHLIVNREKFLGMQEQDRLSFIREFLTNWDV